MDRVSSGCVRDAREKGDVLCNVAVDKDVAWTCACEDGFGDARVGAADPEDLWVVSRYDGVGTSERRTLGDWPSAER